MCGRYASSRNPDDLVTEFEVTTPAPRGLEPDYNVAPTKEVYAVIDRAPAERHLKVVRWGLVPFWAKDPAIGSRMINARGETAATKPAFRAAFARRRCVLPADGYYEWYTPQRQDQRHDQRHDEQPPPPQGARGRAKTAAKALKQPYYLSPADGGVFAMAGLYEIWRDPTRSDEDPLAYRWTTTVLTTTAIDSLGHIHDRMPQQITASALDDWLNPEVNDTEAVTALLTVPEPGYLLAVPVSREVNNVANNGPQLTDPLPLEPGRPDQPDRPVSS